MLSRSAGLFTIVLLSSLELYSQRAKLILPFGHTGIVNGAVLSPDKKTIASVSNDQTLKIWDVESGLLLSDIKAHNQAVRSVAFSKDGTRIMTSSIDSTIKIWDTENLNLIARFRLSAGVFKSIYSPDGKKIIVAPGDGYISILDAGSGNLIKKLSGHKAWAETVSLNNDGTKLVSGSEDETAIIWDLMNGKLLMRLEGHTQPIKKVTFSNDGMRVATASIDSTIRVWDVNTGIQQLVLKGHAGKVNTVLFSADDKTIISGSNDKTIKIWDARTGKELGEIKTTAQVSDLEINGEQITAALANRHIIIWNFKSKALIKDISGASSFSFFASLSPDGKRMASATETQLKLWDAVNGQFIKNVSRISSTINSVAFSQDGKKILTASDDLLAAVWDIETGHKLATFKGHTGSVRNASFSPDNKKVLTSSLDKSVRIWNAETGTQLSEIRGFKTFVWYASFSPDGKKITTTSSDKTTVIWDAETGRMLTTLTGQKSDGICTVFSPDGKRVATSTINGELIVWNVETGGIIASFKHHTWVFSFKFSQDGNRLLSASGDQTIKLWDINDERVLLNLTGHKDGVWSVDFSKDEKFIFSSSADNTFKKWDAKTGQCLYTFFPVKESDYLIFDVANHYDGSEMARKLIYFTCGKDVVELDQVKDQLWVPDLGERIMRGEAIQTKTLDELNICGLSPDITQIDGSDDMLRFNITPRRGGLGETAVLINGIEVKRYRKESLMNKNGKYELAVKKDELKSYFIPGQDNPITIRSWITDNTISSRGLIVKEDRRKESATAPNLYAVIIGISDYKGEELDLKYAAKDATDISTAIAGASRKLLNSDGKEHVFIYNLTTSQTRYQLPEKTAIQKTLEEIGKKATANDILFIFFAGHGIMDGKEQKQFYLLTADASRATASDAVKDVGISTAELTEWIKPANIKSQKRILIFDACNSGQAIRDFVQLGKPDQGYIAARNDEKSQQVKAIEKLNNQSGLVILAASASDQSAYEMSRYSQGLLTYALLKVLKQQPEILEGGKYLDVNNWLNAAKKLVSSLAEGTGARQEPQLNSNNNFNIGVVDEEIRNKITLAAENPIFTRSNFQNADSKIDNIKLRNAVDKQLLVSGNQGLTYSADYDGADAFTLTGDYKINGDDAIISVMLVKEGVDIKHRFEIKGKKGDPDAIATLIISAAVDWLKKNR